ncbi:MAG: DNA primase [Dehalococcoidia bacterium]|nr:DNA primase [Dehalococcoidia bacterium]
MNTVDDIKQKIDIVDVVSQYVKLQKSGRNFKAACPFHSEKTASFFVFPEKQSWHCFGACGTGGDVFSFIMKKEGIDFSQALRMLAEEAGVTLSYQSQQNVKEEQVKYESLFKLNEVTAEYFHYLLLHSKDAETARQYVKKRALAPKTIENFQIGYALDRWDDLSSYLIKSGYKENDMLAVGLIVLRDKGGYYDRFRNRLMFPIRDIKGRVVGFGGRALDDSLPKYLNSPQTAIFDKSGIIYGIDRAQTAIRQKDSVVITEGYMDTIAAHEFGFENTVASMGTALTGKQISILRKLSKNIIFALDSDQAGLEATARSILTIDEQIPKEHWMPWIESKTYNELLKYEIQVVEIQDGKDPDEIIRKSPEKWAKLLDAPQPIIDFTLKKEIDTINRDDPKEKSAIVSKFLPILSQIDDPVRRAHYVQKLAGLLKLDERSVRDALVNSQKQEKQYKQGKINKISRNYADQTADSRSIEEYCLALLLKFPDLMKSGKNIDTIYFEHSDNRDILLRWQLDTNLEAIAQDLDPALSEYLNHLFSLGDRFPPSLSKEKKEREHALDDCINRLQERYVKSLELKKKLVLTEEREDGNSDMQLAKLVEHGIKESQQLHDIFRKRGRLFKRTKGV